VCAPEQGIPRFQAFLGGQSKGLSTSTGNQTPQPNSTPVVETSSHTSEMFGDH